MKTEYKGLSHVTTSLIKKEEGFDVDFKRDAKFDPKDVVAFANSETGGTIILGIDEIEDLNGRKKGKIYGLKKIGDDLRLSILSKIQDTTVPPVKVQVYFENTGTAKPIARISIPSGKNKPYSTKSGVYTIRDDGKNKPLRANDMLEIFLGREFGRFVNLFRSASEDVIKVMISELEKVNDKLIDTRFSLETQLDRVDASAQDAIGIAEELSLELSSQIGDDFNIKFEEVQNAVLDNETRLKRIMRKFNLEDPIVEKQRQQLKEIFRKSIMESLERGEKPDKKKNIEIAGSIVFFFLEERRQVSLEEAEELYDEVLSSITS